MFIRKMIHDALLHPGVRDSHTHVGFYPSQASVEYTDEDNNILHIGACLRKQFYSHCGVPRKPLDPDVAVKMELGNWTHEMIVELVKRSGNWMGDERRMFLSGPPPVSGRADLFVKNPRDGSITGCEIKSISGYYGVKTIIKSKDARPKMDAVLQCMPYLDFYGKFGLTTWILLYIDRESGAMAEYVITLEEDSSVNIQGENFAEIHRHINLKAIRDRWNKLSNHIVDGTLPLQDYDKQWSNKTILQKLKKNELTKTDKATVDRKLKTGKTDGPLLKKGDWQCVYCDYADRCWSKTPFDPQDIVQITQPVAMKPEQVAQMKATNKTKTVNKIDGGEMF